MELNDKGIVINGATGPLGCSVGIYERGDLEAAAEARN
jgi:hypothetical protein